MEKINLNKVEISLLNISDIDTLIMIQKELNINILNKKSIEEDLKNSNFKYFIARYNNDIVGFISILAITEIEIEALVIKKDFQKMGIGNLLLNYIFEFAKSNKIDNIFLEVRISNIPAIALYKKNGFKNLSIRKNYYTDTNEAALILKKSIIH